MCAIIGSFSLERLKKLVELNSYRGTHSYSFSTFHSTSLLAIIKRDLGIFPDLKGEWGPHYFIAHVQAPTTESRTSAAIHPAAHRNAYLWHNGILKTDTISYLRDKHHIIEDWDTQLLLYDLVNSPLCSRRWESLSNIDGSFSCLMLKQQELYLFRNQLAPMFINKENMDISSTKFQNSVETDPDTVYLFNPHKKTLEPEAYFQTMQNPYYFSEN